MERRRSVAQASPPVRRLLVRVLLLRMAIDCSILDALVAFIAPAALIVIRTETERKLVRSAFAQYLPPDVVNEIANDPSKLKLGGETRDLTIMFCDIRGFTPIAESSRGPQG